MKELRVEVVDFADDTRWSWRLLDEKGAFLADHDVDLDVRASEYSGFVDLHSFVRWNLDMDSTPGDAQALVSRIGDWIRTEAWGAIGDAILAAAKNEPVTVLVAVPPAAEILLFRPFELAFVLDPAPGALDVSLVLDIENPDRGPQPDKRQIGDRLRMLALFSAPTDQAALDIRHERHELRRLVQRVALAAERAVELRVLQYGVTRDLLVDVLEQGDSWDLIHFSGHGLPEGLVLEHPDGKADVIPSSEFADLLRPARAQLKLVTLSSCESGAMSAAQAMHLLGIADAKDLRELTQRSQDGAVDSALPGVAQRLTEQLGCAVLAMRYPVDDGFAVDLSADLYEGLLAHQQTLTRALQRTLKKATDKGRNGISLATPALFGTPALDLKLDPPHGKPATFSASRSKLAYFEPEPEHFVGRVRQLANASSALAPKSDHRAVVFHGMAGAGKTSCALELAYRHEEHRFEAMAWHRAPNDGENIEGALAQFAISLETQLEGLEFAYLVDDVDRLKLFLPRLRSLMAERSLLIVLDNVESLLADDGKWRDERWALVIDALISHNGLSRLVLTSRKSPATLLDRPEVLVQSIDSLTASESALLARQLPNLGPLMTDGAGLDQEVARKLVRRTLEIVQGNPKLIELADRQAADVNLLKARIEEADEAWADQADLGKFFVTGQPDDEIEAEDFLHILERWTHGIAATLPEDSRLAFQVLCCLEPNDRRLDLSGLAMSIIWKDLERTGDPPDPGPTFVSIAAQGLIDIETRGEVEIYKAHPAVEEAERKVVKEDVRHAVDMAMGMVWSRIHQQGTKDEDTRAVVYSGLAAAPYLFRLGYIESAAGCLARAVALDPAPHTVAAALPQLHRAVALTEGTAVEHRARAALLRARSAQHSGDDMIPELRESIQLARDDNDLATAEVLRDDLFNELLRQHRLKELEEELDAPVDPEVEARFGVWSQVAREVQRLQLIHRLGKDEMVLTESGQLMARLEEIDPAESSDGEIDVPRWNVRETVLGTARSAAMALKKWDLALELNAAIRKSERERGAPKVEQAMTDFSDHGPLLELDRIDEAEQMLRRVRRTLEEANDVRRLGSLFDAWAILEHRRGRLDSAITFGQRALRVAYRFGEPDSINNSHHNLANHLIFAKRAPGEILVHRLAETLISYQTGSGDYPGDLRVLKAALSMTDEAEIPDSFEALCERLWASSEVEFDRLFAQLPQRTPSGAAALAAILDDASRPGEGPGPTPTQGG